MATAVLDPAIQLLVSSREPLIRYRALVDLEGVDREDARVREAFEAIPSGPVVRALLEDRPEKHPYSKWAGLHWRLVSLMDLGVPAQAIPERIDFDREFGWLTGRGREPRRRKVPVLEGRARVCGSQDGNALAVAVHFGMADDPRARVLAEALVDWQWPDGGWNCDRHPEASHASVNESFGPLRGLAAYARATGDRAARTAADRAAEFFLRHRVVFSERTGEPMRPVVVELHYPTYWHYDLLIGLRVLAETGHIDDPRTRAALDLLVSKRRPDGGWSADKALYRRPGSSSGLVEVADWTAARQGRVSEPLTLFALLVLKAAGRLG
jgi:hypothetical protein